MQPKKKKEKNLPTRKSPFPEEINTNLLHILLERRGGGNISQFTYEAKNSTESLGIMGGGEWGSHFGNQFDSPSPEVKHMETIRLSNFPPTYTPKENGNTSQKNI